MTISVSRRDTRTESSSFEIDALLSLETGALRPTSVFPQNIDYEALWEVLWMAVLLCALVCFVLWLIT